MSYCIEVTYFWSIFLTAFADDIWTCEVQLHSFHEHGFLAFLGSFSVCIDNFLVGSDSELKVYCART